MNFNKTALASFALVSAAAANAQSTAPASTTNVTLYGVLDAYVQYASGASNLTRVQSGGLSGSRFGVRGNEDLGGGLRAFFTLESGINVDDGTYGQNTFWGRQVFVGLGNSTVGQISLGRQYSSIYNLSSDFSVFSNVGTGASTAVIGGFGGYEPVRGRSASGTSTDGGPARINNSVKLESANFGGFRVGALAGLGETSGLKDNHVADVYARYSAGAFDAMLSYVEDKAAATALDVRTISGAAAYRFGDARVTAGVISVNDRTALNRDGQGVWLGADYRMGASILKAQFVQSKNKGSLAEGQTRALGGGYEYQLSKRTSLYSTLTYYKNEGTGYTNRWAGSMPTGLTSTTDRNITEVVGGIRHTF